MQKPKKAPKNGDFSAGPPHERCSPALPMAECFRQLKRGRPAAAQKYLDKLIAIEASRRG